MTRDQYVKKYNEAFEFKGLHCGMIFHYDPLLEIVEVRSIYSAERIEVVLWGEEEMKFYRSKSIDATFFVDGEVQDIFGDVHKYLEVK